MKLRTIAVALPSLTVLAGAFALPQVAGAAGTAGGAGTVLIDTTRVVGNPQNLPASPVGAPNPLAPTPGSTAPLPTTSPPTTPGPSDPLASTPGSIDLLGSGTTNPLGTSSGGGTNPLAPTSGSGTQLAAQPSSAPAITTNPVSQTVTAGSVATFTAAASGSPTPTVKWRASTNRGLSWSTISGATSTTLAFTTTSAENGWEFDAVFTNSAGKATTSAATLTVTTPTVAPVITENPVSASVAAGATASFTAAASGSPAPTVQWWFSANGGSSWTGITGATATTYRFTTTAAENGWEFEAVFTNAVGSATTTPATLTVTTAPLESTNWSGYADTGATFDSVSGSWTVPTVSCTPGENAYSAQWIGIDGYSSSTVEQDGTETDCIDGSPSYDAWYEMYGDNAVNSGYEVELSPATDPVAPGDSLTASVSQSAGVWTLSIADANQGWTYTTTVAFTGAAQSSAEWVVERPELCGRTCSLSTLPNFGSVTFTGASAGTATSTAPISGYADTAIDMVSGSSVIAEVGPLTQGGSSFTDTYL